MKNSPTVRHEFVTLDRTALILLPDDTFQGGKSGRPESYTEKITVSEALEYLFRVFFLPARLRDGQVAVEEVTDRSLVLSITFPDDGSSMHHHYRWDVRSRGAVSCLLEAVMMWWQLQPDSCSKSAKQFLLNRIKGRQY